jgi:hypothetical protein
MPCSNGLSRAGVITVLSQITGSLSAWAAADNAAKSGTSFLGLPKDSKYTQRVFASANPAICSGWAGSKKRTSMPSRRNVWVNNVQVPP